MFLSFMKAWMLREVRRVKMREEEWGRVREDHSADTVEDHIGDHDKLSSNPSVSCFLNYNFFSTTKDVNVKIHIVCLDSVCLCDFALWIRTYNKINSFNFVMNLYSRGSENPHCSIYCLRVFANFEGINKPFLFTAEET